MGGRTVPARKPRRKECSILKNSKFSAYAVMLCFLGILYMFLSSGLLNAQYDILRAFLTEAGGGWHGLRLRLPILLGDLLGAAVLCLFGRACLARGIRRAMVPFLMACALGCVALAGANGLDVYGGASAGNYGLFVLAILLIRGTALCLPTAGFLLASQWCVRCRGRIMGIISMGCPLFLLIGSRGMIPFIAAELEADYRSYYLTAAAAILVLAVMTRAFLQDAPEEAELFPDGADHAPRSEEDDEDEPPLTPRQVLSLGRTWLLVAAFGAFQFVFTAAMYSAAARYVSLGGEALWSAAARWLTLGALLGIPMSYLFGLLDDKRGTVIASLLLGLTELITVLALWRMPPEGSIPLEVLWAFGVACMIGGVPVLRHAAIAFAFGRREYPAASPIILAIQAIPSAFAAWMMDHFLAAGRAGAAYRWLIAVIILGLIASLLLRSIRDINADDRDCVPDKTE